MPCFWNSVMPSFDTVCEPNLVEVKNAVDNTAKEIATRFDFKGTPAAIEFKDKEVTLIGNAEITPNTKARAATLPKGAPVSTEFPPGVAALKAHR